MEKVYRLLRNNQQTGPHTLEELIQLGLKPYDLIWVEGRSYGWQYPSEVPTLKAYAPEVPAEKKKDEPKKEEKKTEQHKVPRRIFVSKPSSPTAPAAPSSEPSYSIEEKAEALRQRIANYTPSSSGDDMQTRYQREVDDIGVDYGAWLYEKKKKKKNYGKLVVAPLLLAAAGFAIYKYWPATSASTLTVMPSAMIPTSKQKEETQETVLQDESSFAAIDSTYVLDTVNAGLKNYTPGPRTAATAGKRNVGGKSTAPDTVQDISQTNFPQPVQEEPVVMPNDVKPEPPAAEPEKKKKGLKGFFGKIFGKKKDKKEEEAEPTVVDITGQVELKNNRSSGGWMMGVQNQKLTLSNRSSAKLLKASVEVGYYSENNALLEKKTIVFQEVSPRSSSTLPVPDHRTADHVVFKVLSATGQGSSQR